MKVELKVNLKIDGKIINAGKKFDDEVEVFPEYVANNLENTNIIKVLVPAKVEDKVVTEVKEVKEEVKLKLNKKK